MMVSEQPTPPAGLAEFQQFIQDKKSAYGIANFVFLCEAT